ncbi:hypothetical protein I314_01281 [Cryptococcus bacillisporus CA1873]|nr:hypothetical protein I314_01281 [Cryptococcus bacillisporus CA1873]|eukprot:KIR68856.1 hypothetical protein I314_01281 [Cryptococcus gattii CA1873]
MRSFFSGLILLPPSLSSDALQDRIATSSLSSVVAYQEGHQRWIGHHPVPALPITTSTNLSRRQGEEAGEEEEGDDGSSNFFIELNPNSPITANRSGSLWTRYTRASGLGFGGSWGPSAGY